MKAEAPPRCVILGGGGHASVVIDAMGIARSASPWAILDCDPRLWGTEVFGVPVRGGDELLPEIVKEGVGHFVVGLGGVGDNRPRQRVFQRGLAQGLAPFTVRHPSAICSRWAEVGAGCVLLAGAVVNTGSVLGENVIVNTGAIVEHDCVVGDHVHVATGARVAGGARIGALAHIGVGATVLQGIVIGEQAIVGAGAVVVEDVPPNTVVVGVPARPISVRVQS